MELVSNNVGPTTTSTQAGQKKTTREMPTVVAAPADYFISCGEDVKTEETKETKKEEKTDKPNKENEELLKLLGEDFQKMLKELSAEDQEDILKLGKSFMPKDPKAKNYKDEMDTTLTILKLLIETRVNLIKTTNNLSDYIKKNKMPFASTVSKLVKEHKFILWGETHLDENYNTPNELIKILPMLKKEADERGEELVLAVEFDVVFKELIESLDKPKKFKEEYLKIYPESQKEKVEEAISDGKITKEEFRSLVPNARGKLRDIIYEAQKLGIKIVPVDYLPFYHKDDVKDENAKPETSYLGITPTQAQKRDTTMSDLTAVRSTPKVKVIFYGGSFHTSEVASTDDHWGKIQTLGTLLRKKFGDEAVVSLRSVDHGVGFTGMSNQNNIIVLNDTKRLPPPAAVMSLIGEKDIVIVPSGGLIKTKDGHHDYVVIDNSPGSR